MKMGDARTFMLAVALVGVLVVVGLVYGPALGGPFLWDDNVLARGGTSSHESIGAFFNRPFWPRSSLAEPGVPYYRPVTLASYALDGSLGGPSQFHFTNVMLHMTACLLLSWNARRLGASVPRAILAALLWGLAPRLSESVAWISGRTDVIAACFGLAALMV